MNAIPTKRLRCAVYTRVSTEEGLGQAYTSIDAQRDAGEAYIASRRSEGWVQASDYYDDGGFSGGTLERPALKRLLADIEAGRIDVIVAYKLDRLSRSLFDFAELVKVFERCNVTFVSVTQHFNTTDAMGRMLLNILLTFAQFERELTSERIRDKFIASKRKGLWMHGIPPLGYDIKDRRLTVNADEAERVRWIFERFIEQRSIQKVAEEALVHEYRNKSWTTAAGRHLQGHVLDKGAIHKILHNRTYLGHIKHRDMEFENTHPAIVSPQVWAEAQAILKVNGRTRANQSRANVEFLLKGLLFDATGRALSPWHTVSASGRMYRYYLTQELMERGRSAKSTLPRLPASEIEALVVAQLRDVMRAPQMSSAVLGYVLEQAPTLDEAAVTVALRQTDRVWDALFPAEQRRLVTRLVEKVIVTPDQVEIRLHPLGFQLFQGAAESKAA